MKEWDFLEAVTKDLKGIVKQQINNVSEDILAEALSIAARNGFYETLKVLLARKPSPKALDSALGLACGDGKVKAEVVIALIKAGANPNSRENQGLTIFDWARKNKRVTILNFLSAAGYHEEVDTKDKVKAEKFVDMLQQEIKKHQLLYISLLINETETEAITPLNSFIGGTPLVPKGFVFPTETDPKLHFFAQLNMSNFPKLPGFPEEGLLLFFLKSTAKAWRDSFVIYIANPPKQTSEYEPVKEFVSATKARYLITSADKVRESYPYPTDYKYYAIFKELAKDLSPKVLELVQEIVSEMEFQRQNQGNRLGGYAFFTQEDPRYNQKYHDYIQLLQVDELLSDEDLMFWGDSGLGHFFIRPDDLKKLDFSKVLFYWDCY
ncbi:MAG TPA: DUF1963 domain-containing protein [Bacillota bacterium]|nr:DUF1963 domain-containing protein [Bacillota bacterium]